MALKSKENSCEQICAHFDRCPTHRKMEALMRRIIPPECQYYPDIEYENLGIYDEYSEIPVSEINKVISTLPDITDGLDPADDAIIEEVELRQSNNLKQLRMALDSMK